MEEMKKVLVTGAHGFIGRNLALALGRDSGNAVTAVDIDTPASELDRGLDICDVVFHLAGVNRPSREEDFETGNFGSLSAVLSGLETRKRQPLVILSSSTQATLDNPYGRSKRHAEELLFDYASRTKTPARIFRLPGVFGKWSRPNYNSVVSTFCHSIAHGLPIQISDPAREIELIYVDDVVSRWLQLLKENTSGVSFADIAPVFHISLGRLAEVLKEFHGSRETCVLPDLSDPLSRRLHSTYISYLPADGFSYSPELRSDARGSLAELMKAGGHGQIFVSRTRPGITRGNHYHDSKVEKFVVLEGNAVICFRHMSTGETAECTVSGRELRIVDIPPGWTHSIKNVGAGDMIVLFWASEIFDPARPDTYPAEVGK